MTKTFKIPLHCRALGYQTHHTLKKKHHKGFEAHLQSLTVQMSHLTIPAFGKKRRAGSDDEVKSEPHDSELENSSDGVDIDDVGFPDVSIAAVTPTSISETGMGDVTSSVQSDAAAVSRQRLRPFEAEEYDIKIAEWVHQGYRLIDIPEMLKEHHHVEWPLRLVQTRYKAWRKANQGIVEAVLDSQLDHWHVGEDDELLNAERIVQRRIEVEMERLNNQKWTEVARILAAKPVRKRRSARAVEERFRAVKSGEYIQPIEYDADPEGRAADLRDQRLHYKSQLQNLMAQTKLDAQTRREQHLADQAASQAVKDLRDMEHAQRSAAAQRRSRNAEWRRSLYNREAEAGDWQNEKRGHDEEWLSRIQSQLAESRHSRRLDRGAQTASLSESSLIKVTAETRASPRMAMTDSQLDTLLASRELQRRAPGEDHDQVVARIAAADNGLTQAALAKLLRAAFGKVTRDRAEDMRRLAEADATLC